MASDIDFVATREELMQRVTNLRAEVESLKEENEKLKGPHPMRESARARINDLTQQLAAANGRVEQAIKWLQRYGRHNPHCDLLDYMDEHDSCTCGFDEVKNSAITMLAALSDLPEADKEKS